MSNSEMPKKHHNIKLMSLCCSCILGNVRLILEPTSVPLLHMAKFD